MKAICVLSTLALATTWIGATDWTVGPSGSGAQFTSIQAAINAAQPGDRVFVMPGTYNGAVVIDKAIELIGAGSTLTTTTALPVQLPGNFPTPASIANIPAGSHVRVSGFTFNFVGQTLYTPGSMMSVYNCAGRVELCDIRLPATLPNQPVPFQGGILHVANCAGVVATGVQCFGNYAVVPFPFPFPMPGELQPQQGHNGILVVNSALWMIDGFASGKSTKFVTSGYGGHGGDGVRAINSFVHLGRSQIRGAQSGGLQPGVVGFGGAAINAFSSYVIVHGADPNLVAGADAFEHTAVGVTGFGASGSAVKLDATSTVVYAPDAMLVPGAPTASLPSAPVITAEPTSLVAPHPHRLPTVSITPVYASVGSTVSVQLSGEPNLDLIRAISLQTAAPLFIPGVLGAVVVDLQAVLLYPVDPLGPSGTVTSSITLPADPGLAGLEFIEQAAQVLPTGIALSPPIVFCIKS